MENTSEWCEIFHDVAATTDCTNRKPTANDFAEACEVWTNIELCLCTTCAKTETGDDFIEHQQRTDAIAFSTKSFKESLCWCNNTHVCGNWFNEYSCNIVIKFWNNVVWHDPRVCHCFFRHASGTRKSQCCKATATSGEQCISCAVEVSVECHDALTACCTARKTHCSTCCFSAAIHKAHPLTGRNSFTDCFGQLHFTRSWCTVRRAVSCCRTNCFRHLRMCMTKNDCAITLHQVNEVRTFDVPHACAFSARHDVWIATNGLKRANGRVHSAWDCLC